MEPHESNKANKKSIETKGPTKASGRYSARYFLENDYDAYQDRRAYEDNRSIVIRGACDV